MKFDHSLFILKYFFFQKTYQWLKYVLLYKAFFFLKGISLLKN